MCGSLGRLHWNRVEDMERASNGDVELDLRKLGGMPSACVGVSEVSAGWRLNVGQC